MFISAVGCLRLCKDTKIKANHNPCGLHYVGIRLSKTLQRYENKSKSQLTLSFYFCGLSCLRLCKDTKIIHILYLFQWCSSRLTPVKQIRVSKNFVQKNICKDTKIIHILYLFQWCSSGLTPVKQIRNSKNFLPKPFAMIRKLFTVLYSISMVFIGANAG